MAATTKVLDFTSTCCVNVLDGACGKPAAGTMRALIRELNLMGTCIKPKATVPIDVGVCAEHRTRLTTLTPEQISIGQEISESHGLQSQED